MTIMARTDNNGQIAGASFVLASVCFVSASGITEYVDHRTLSQSEVTGDAAPCEFRPEFVAKVLEAVAEVDAGDYLTDEEVRGGDSNTAEDA